MKSSEVCGEFISFYASALDAIFDTGFLSFVSLAGCHGLAKEDPENGVLEVLAVSATKPGTGQFRNFIKQAQQSYNAVVVWHDFGLSGHLHEALLRYGFVASIDPANKTTHYAWIK